MKDNSERTEQPSPRRLQKAREKGDFPISRELVASLQFLTFVFVLKTWGGEWFTGAQMWFSMLLRQAFQSELTPRTVIHMAGWILQMAFLPLAAAGALLMAVTAGSHFSVTGMGFSLKRFTTGLSALNPAAKLKEIRENAFSNTVQAFVMLAVSGVVLYWVARNGLMSFPLLPLASLRQGTGVVFDSVLSLLWKGAALFILLGVVDVLRQRKRYWSRLRMTKQEVREEYKENEGSPEIKMRLRRLRRDLLRRRMMQSVPTATAVLVNPTHYAVALRYDHETMRCPVVVAKGKNYLALRIRACALENQVPIIENPPLAQALYKSVEVGQEIPPNFYRAIAEVLAYVYRLANMTARRAGG